MTDYYKILGVERGVTGDVVRNAYRILAKRYHPDLNPGDPAAAEAFKSLSEAYSVLSDPVSRAEYDSTLSKRPGFSDFFREIIRG